jgi:hypothetical protein
MRRPEFLISGQIFGPRDFRPALTRLAAEADKKQLKSESCLKGQEKSDFKSLKEN